MAFIKNWCEKEKTRNPIVINLAAKCLKAIKLDPNARMIFHHRHVLNSARLRSGYDKAFKEKTTGKKLKRNQDEEEEAAEEEEENQCPWTGEEESEESEEEDDDE